MTFVIVDWLGRRVVAGPIEDIDEARTRLRDLLRDGAAHSVVSLPASALAGALPAALPARSREVVA